MEYNPVIAGLLRGEVGFLWDCPTEVQVPLRIRGSRDNWNCYTFVILLSAGYAYIGWT
jgi:hypothetical protein